jgi:TolA-binding protein
VPITAVCPECETRYQLEDNLLGKRISCPTCKAVFLVESLTPPVPPKPVTADHQESRNQSGKIEDFVPLLNEVEIPTPIEEVWSPEIEPPQVVESLPKPIEQTSPPEATTPKPTREKRRKASKVEEPASPPEETWTPESSPPQVEEYQEPVKPIYEESRSLPVKRKKRSSYRVPALIAMVLFILGSIGVGGVYLKRYMDLAPDRLYQTATDEYTASHFDQARKLFEQLAREYPSHPKAGEAKFFTELAGLRTGVGSVVNRSNPQPALDQWKQFLETIKQPDLASFAERDRYGFDIWQGGSKLAEDLVGKGEDSFDREKPEDSETWVKSAAAVEEELERFRPSQMSKPALPAGKVLQDKIIAARNRLKDLEELKTLVASASDTTLGQARRFAATRGLEKDDTFLSLYQDAEKKIRSRAVYNVQNPPISPVAFPDDNLPSLIFTPRLDRTPNRRLPGP